MLTKEQKEFQQKVEELISLVSSTLKAIDSELAEMDEEDRQADIEQAGE